MPDPVLETTQDGSPHEFRCHHPVPAGTSDAELVTLARAATPKNPGLEGPATDDVEETV
jgi:peptide/nickel transport system ATP-binding protein